MGLLALIPALLRTPWVRWVALGLLVVFAGWQGVEYLTAVARQSHLRKQQTAAKAERIEQANISQKARSAYQLDSMRQATRREPLLHQDSILAHTDREISTTRPHWIELPAEPPVEGPTH